MLRVGYGPCQGGFCMWRAAAMLAEGPAGAGVAGDGDPRREGAGRPDPLVNLERFIEERWRGQHTTIWGDQARQLLLNQAIYCGIFDLGPDVPPDEAVALPAETEALAELSGSGTGSA
jgi:glycerol-3-phosphate dehydrogenase